MNFSQRINVLRHVSKEREETERTHENIGF